MNKKQELNKILADIATPFINRPLTNINLHNMSMQMTSASREWALMNHNYDLNEWHVVAEKFEGELGQIKILFESNDGERKDIAELKEMVNGGFLYKPQRLPAPQTYSNKKSIPPVTSNYDDWTTMFINIETAGEIIFTSVKFDTNTIHAKNRKYLLTKSLSVHVKDNDGVYEAEVEDTFYLYGNGDTPLAAIFSMYDMFDHYIETKEGFSGIVEATLEETRPA